MSTEWADISEFQVPLNDAYPYRWVAFRSNDGTRVDAHFARNIAWARSAVATGRLDGFYVYAVYRPDGGAWARTLINLCGTADPCLCTMTDVESWPGTPGEIRGDHSADINAGMALLDAWTTDPRRNVGYGNQGDLTNLWPGKGSRPIVLANYSNMNAQYPGKFAQQYTDAGQCPPFGTADMNYTPMDSAALAAFLGINGTDGMEMWTDADSANLATIAAASQKEVAPPNLGVYVNTDTGEACLGSALFGADLPQFTGTGGAPYARTLDAAVTLYRGFAVSADPTVILAWSRAYSNGNNAQTARVNRADYIAIQIELSRVATLSTVTPAPGPGPSPTPTLTVDEIATGVRAKFAADPLTGNLS